MRVDFDETFKSELSANQLLPDMVIKELNKELPSGLEYVMNSEGDIIVHSTTGKMVIGGLNIVITEAMRKHLGVNINPADVLNYSYNSQTPIHLKPQKRNKIIINGTEMPIQKLAKNSFHNAIYEGSKCIAYPQKFPEMKPIKLSSEDGEHMMELPFKRVPYKSATKACFETVGKYPLLIKLFIPISKVTSNGERIQSQITAKIMPKKANNLSNLIDALWIFHDILCGKGKVNGLKFADSVTKNNSLIDISTIRWYEKAKQIEDMLHCTFSIRNIELDAETLDAIESLYYGLIKEMPIKEYKIINSITVGKNSENIKDIIDKNIGENIAYEFESKKHFTVFGKDLLVPVICVTYETCITDVNKTPKDEYLIKFAEYNADSPGYVSMKLFANKKAIKEFVASNGVNDEFIKYMKTANTAYEYYQLEDVKLNKLPKPKRTERTL